MPRNHLVPLLLACLFAVGCTCEPLGVDKLRFACDEDADCVESQRCVDHECRPAGATGGGDGAGGGSATTGGGTATTGGGTATTGGGTATTGGGTATTGGGTATTGGGTATTGGGSATTGGGTATGGGPSDAGACVAATTLPFSGGAANVRGVTSGVTTIAGACGGSMSPEQVFTFTQAATGPFIATVAPRPDGGTLRPVIYVRSACGSAPDIGCKLLNAVEPSSLTIGSLDAGTYFLVVDGYGPSATAGPYTLTAYQGTPPGDSCISAGRTVTLSDSEPTVTIAGDTTGMASNANLAACATTNAADLVYSVTPPRSGVLTVESFGVFDIALAASSDCEGSGILACSDDNYGGDDSAERVSVPVVAGTTYWVWVKGAAPSQRGAFQLVFTLP